MRPLVPTLASVTLLSFALMRRRMSKREPVATALTMLGYALLRMLLLQRPLLWWI